MSHSEQSDTDTLDVARRILAAAMNMEEAAVTDDAAIGNVAAWDSLAHMRLIMALEERLGSALPPDTVVAIGCLQDIVAVLEGRKLEVSGW